ncbi:MAG: zinc-ribbon domain-containing protein [Dehalococcoidia bacterium]|jgi:uncharacterized membrane protein YvbJ
MKCPSCGYENQEGAQYCNLCLHSFVKPQPEKRPRRVQSQMVTRENQANKEAEKVK